MTVIAEIRAINSKYMNATTIHGIAFRSGLALVDSEGKLAQALQMEGVQVTPREAYLEQLPAVLDTLGPFKPVKADIFLPEGYRLRQSKDGWQMLLKNKTLEQRYPIPDPEPAPALVLGWTPPDME